MAKKQTEEINLLEAIDMIAAEKDISSKIILEALEGALLSAYKNHLKSLYEQETDPEKKAQYKTTTDNARVEINKETGKAEIILRYDIVEDDDYEDKETQIKLSDAREQYNEKFVAGDYIDFIDTPENFGRIAAQTAKQVFLQKVRDAERDIVFDDYVDRRGEIINGRVQRVSNGTIFVDLGKTDGILSRSEQVPSEHFRLNDTLKAYIMDVKRTTKGPQIFLSRSHPGLVKKLFELEVPEIEDGIVEIVSMAREAGSRTKMAVYSSDETIDAVGACVGTNGTRVQNVVDEISGEKIDIINWSDDPTILISNVLKPADVEQVIVDDEEKSAVAIVPDYQLSLAIGKDGQNVRLAAKVSGWKIDIKSESQFSDTGDLVDVEEIDDMTELEEAQDSTEE